jgi:hypothetical protein
MLLIIVISCTSMFVMLIHVQSYHLHAFGSWNSRFGGFFLQNPRTGLVYSGELTVVSDYVPWRVSMFFMFFQKTWVLAVASWLPAVASYSPWTRPASLSGYKYVNLLNKWDICLHYIWIMILWLCNNMCNLSPEAKSPS